MTISSGQMTVGLTALQIDSAQSNPSRLHIHNDDVSDSLYIGSESVTSTTGMQLIKLDSLELQLQPNERVWLVSTKIGHKVSWLRQDL